MPSIRLDADQRPQELRFPGHLTDGVRILAFDWLRHTRAASEQTYECIVHFYIILFTVEQKKAVVSMLSQHVMGGQVACLLDTCQAVAMEVIHDRIAPSVSVLDVMLGSLHKAIDSLRWISLALLISTRLVDVPLARNGTLVRNGTVVSDAYFFGQSPPVYPSPLGNGTGDWAESYARAADLVAQLTMDEKISLTGGVLEGNGCDGNIAPIYRLGFPGLCLKDSGNGVRQTDHVNGYPAAIHAGSSWNRGLVHQRASHMGMEFRLKGINLLLGPTIGPMGRVVTGGRNWESFSADPYLTGQLAFETVKGIQEVGVVASTKHFLANEQETNRQDSKTARREPGVEGVSSNIDDKTLHELYVWPFQDALYAGSGSIMCSYNRLNNSYACQNSKLLNGILKDELGFQGYVVTDWEAQHSGVGSVLAGLDMTMPTPKEYWGFNLSVSIRNGSVSESRLDDMATRILAPWYKMGQNNGYPGRGMNKKIEAKNPASKPVLFDGAVEGHVLVKNVDGVLPLRSPRLLSLYGYDAKTPEVVKGDLPNWEIQSQIATSGTIIGGGGSASVTPARISSPYAALEQRAYDDNTSLFWDFTNNDASSTVDDDTDACLVFINAWAQEGFDRPGTHDDFSDNLVNNIANQCANTIVVIHNAGIRLVDRFESHPNVKAIIFGHLPGQDSGRALVSLLYGDDNFSGKLPYTVAKDDSDYGDLLFPSQPEGLFSLYPQSNFTEGVYIDYRAFDKYNITPRYEFGFGLSYTTFSYSGLRISGPAKLSLRPYPTGRILQGGQEDLWEQIATVYADVTNVGDVEGKEVAQLYVGIPGGPVKQLRGFEKQNIAPGETVTVEFPLTRRDLSVWDVVAQKWKLQKGDYMVHVGSSSRKLPLTGTLIV